MYALIRYGTKDSIVSEPGFVIAAYKNIIRIMTDRLPAYADPSNEFYNQKMYLQIDSVTFDSSLPNELAMYDALRMLFPNTEKCVEIKLQKITPIEYLPNGLLRCDSSYKIIK